MTTDRSEQAPNKPEDGKTTPAQTKTTPAETERPQARPAQEGGLADASAADADAALQEALSEVSRVKDQLLRTAADFDNFRKRTRRELEDAERRGREELLRELLPVFDNLERAVQHAGQATDAKAVADGVDIVLRQFLDTLGRIGIQRVATVGTPFDPARHEAIQQMESPNAQPGAVIAEVRPGYMIGDKLVRAAMVVVAKAPQKGDGTPKPEPT